MPTKRAGSAEADPSREGEEGRRDTPPPPPPQRSPVGRQAQPRSSAEPRGQARRLPTRTRTQTPPQPRGTAAPSQRAHRGRPKRAASARRSPGPEAPAPPQLRPHRYRGGCTNTAPQAAPAATLHSGRHPSPSITNLPPSHGLPAPQAGHGPGAEHAGSCSPKPPPSPPSCEEAFPPSNYSSQEPQRRRGR